VAAIMVSAAAPWSFSTEATEETGLQLRITSRRQQQLLLHAAEIVLRTAMLDARVGEGGIGTRGGKQQGRRNSSAKGTLQMRQQTGHAPPPRIPLRDRAKRRVLMTRP
jgi:hypothetical protein